MTKKIRKRRANYFYNGGFSWQKDASFGKNMSNAFNSGALNGAIGAASSIVGQGISGGLSSGVGSAMQGLGSIASAIPGPWGGIVGGGLNIVGGAVNRLVGSQINKQAVANFRNQNSQQSNTTFKAATTNDLISQGNFGLLGLIKQDEVGKDGWFSNKAKELTAELNRQRAMANNQIVANYRTAASNLDEQNDFNALANYAAFGGPLHTHGADWTNGITVIDNGGTHEQNPFEGVPMGIAPDGQPNLVEEGEVIFNDYVFSNRLRVPKAVREKYKLRGQKEMTFADAAKKAQKESEERPNDPISQRGLEDIMYKLMTEQEAIRESRQQRKYSEGGRIYIAPSKKGTFTAAASKHGMGVQEFASKVLANPEDYSPAMRKKANFARNASKWKHAYGGHLFWDGGWGNNLFNIPELTTTGTPPRITPYISLLDPLSGVKARATTNINSLQTESPYTVPGFPRFTMGQGLLQPPKLKIPAVKTPTRIEGTTYQEPKTSYLANLRYLPAVGSAINVFTDLMGWTNKPDYSNADMIVDAANQFGSVGFSPIGDYMTYTPLDRLFYANKLDAQAGATRRAILNTSGGNRGMAIAGLLAADYNAQGQLGNLFRQAEEYNLAQREKVAAFNRGTKMFNREQGLKAAIANRERDKVRIDALVKAAAIRDAVDSRVGAARSANLTNLFDSLGNIGREAATRNMILSNPALYYSIDSTGKITYKNGYESLSDAAKDEVNRHAAARTKTRAHGGYITIRRRR